MKSGPRHRVRCPDERARLAPVMRQTMAIQQQTNGVERPQNRLLNGLPAADAVRWMLHLESVELHCEQLLCESDTEYLYFPTSAIVSMLYVTEGGESTEIAVIGNDGAVGMSIFMNGNTQPIQAKVQSAGHAYRVRGHFVREEAHRRGPMLDILEPARPGDARAGSADRGLQSSPLDRSAVVPSPADRAGSIAVRRTGDVASTCRESARRAPGERHRCRTEAAGRRDHSL